MDTKQMLIYAGVSLLVILIAFGIYKWMTADKKEGFEEVPSVFRMFYADWCGHCTATKPVFKKILGIDNMNGKPLKIMMLNAEALENQDLVSKFQVNSFPTFILSKSNGENISYSGLRNEDAFLNFLQTNV